jgi:ribosomal protein L11 methyltransferase
LLEPTLILRQLSASNQNAENNQTSAINFYTSDKSTNDLYDIVVANILSSALKVLEPLIHFKCKPQGRIALSGILQSQENEIKEIYSHNFVFEDSLYQDGWVCITALRKS